MAMDMATLGIKVDATDVTKASAELEKLSTAGGKTAQSMTSAEKAAASMGVRMNSLNSITAAFGVTLGLAGVAAFGKSLADTVQKIQDLSIRLQGLTKSADDYAKVQAYLVDISIRHHKSNLVLADSFSRLLTLEQTGLITRKQSMALLEGMSNASSKTGASTEQLKQSMFGLSQAMGSGVVHMEELNQVTEPMPGLLNKIAEASGFTVGEFRKLIAEGRVTSDVFGRIMVGAFESYQGAAEAAGETITAKYADIGNAWTDLAKLLEAPVSGTLTSILEAATWQLEQFVIQAKYAKSSWESIFGASATGGAPDNGMTIDLKGRAKPPAQVDTAKANSAAIRAEIEATAGSTKGKKDLEKAANDAARAQASLAKSFDDTITALSLNIVEQSQSKRQLEEATLVSKKYNKAMIEQAMVLWDAKTALEAKKQLNEEEKSQLDSLIDRYNKATMSARDYYSSTLTVTSPDGIKSPMSGADKAPLLAQFDKTTVAEDASKAHEDAKTALDAYNTSLDDAKTKTQDLGAITSAIFDGALGGISLLTGAFTAMTDEITKNTAEMTRLNEEKQKIADFKPQGLEEEAAKFKAAKKNTKELSDLDKKSVQDQMTGARQIAGAASKMFAEKSAGAKAFHAIEVGIAIAQLAMRAKDMAMSAIATIKNIAEGASKLFAQSGWAGFAGVAAMLALMAGLGFAASSGGGSGGTPPPTDTGTGTVLGDPSAVSESISKTNDLLKNIHASEYVELRGINRGVNNLQGAITKTVASMFQDGGTAIFQLAKTVLTGASGFISQLPGFFGTMAGKISEFFIGGKVTQSIVAQGLGTNKTNLGKVSDGGNVSAYQFADILTHTSGGIFGSSKDEYSTQWQAVSAATQDALNGVFKNIGKTMLSVGEFLGKELGTNLRETVYKSAIPAMRIDLMGLNGEDASKKVNGVISATMDKMSSKLFGSIVKQYQLLGEGMLETTIRIVSEIAIVKDALKQSGLKLLKEDIVGVSDAIVQASGGLEEFQKQFEDYYDKFHTDAEKQARLQTRLVDTMKESSLVLPKTRDGYRQLVEGLNLSNKLDQDRYVLLMELAGAADTYYASLEQGAKDAQKLLDDKRRLEIQIMELSGNTLGALTAKRAAELAAMDSSLQFSQQAVWALQDANQKVANAVGNVSKAMQVMTTLASKLRSALGSSSSSPVTLNDRQNAQAFLTSALAIAKAGGSITNLDGMDKALADIAKPSENLYASFTDYARAQAEASATISQLADYADAQVSMAQKQIDAINGTTSAVYSLGGALAGLAAAVAERNILESSILAAQLAQTAADKAKADAAITSAALLAATTTATTDKAAADAAQKLSDTVAALPDASTKLSTLKGQYADLLAMAADVGITVTDKTAKTLAGLTDQYNKLGIDVAAAALKSALNLEAISAVSAIAVTLLMEANATAQATYQTALAVLAAAQGIVTNPQAPTTAKVAGFASGGFHDGGWRMVGENGPELEKTGSSKIYSNQQSKSLVDNSELVAEVKALREEIRAGQAVIANNTKATTKILRDVTQNGTSISTVAA